MCLLCNKPSAITPFCLDHQKGWIQSKERQAVDFSDEMAYVEGVFRYVERIEKHEDE
jgi:hypothetical protein